ncbi:hypothetical protein M15_05670 [Atrimonas thermophila]
MRADACGKPFQDRFVFRFLFFALSGGLRNRSFSEWAKSSHFAHHMYFSRFVVAGSSAGESCSHLPGSPFLAASKEELLQVSDIVTIHMPLTERTQNFISEREFELMKPGAYLVNTSRGGLVDHAALITALQRKRIAGAALDVFYREPLPEGDRILEFDNVVLTPHIGGSTVEALERLGEVVIENCLRVKRGERPLYVVNGVI